MPRSSLTAIRHYFPHTLESLDLTFCHFLRELPDLLLPRLTHVSLAGMRLRQVPALPPSLRHLDLSHNWSPFAASRLRIPPHVMALANCEIDVNFTGITRDSLPPIPASRAGPVFLNLADDEAASVLEPRPIEQVLAGWFEGADPESADSLAAARIRWTRIAEVAGPAEDFARFRVFVDRLAAAQHARDPDHGAAFRAQVREWLVECSKPERAALREASFAVCLDADGACQGRTSWMFIRLKSLRLNDDITFGAYDGRVPEIVLAAREAFLKDELEKITARKADAIDAARERAAATAAGAGAPYEPCNRLDIYLAYLVELGSRAGGHFTGAETPRFFQAAGISEAEVAQAWPELRERLAGPGFETFLSRDFFPWKALMKRNFRAPYLAVETQLRDTMEATKAARMDAELARMGLDRADPGAAALINDAVADLEPRIQREIEDAAYQDLTRRFLQANNLAHLLWHAPPPAAAG